MTRRADRTRFALLPVLLGAFAVVALFVGALPAAAGQVGPSANACMQPVFTANGGSGLQCTANDVTISVATPTAVDGTACGKQGEPDCTCEEDSTISVDLDVTYQLSGGGSNKTRYDLGAYFDVSGDGTNGARTGKCIHATLQPGDTGYYSAPGEGTDSCGDIDTAHNPLTTSITLTGLKCTKAPGTDKLQLPYCLSWRQPGSNEFCEAPAEAAGPDTILHTNDDIITTDAFPGSPSKCRCDDNFFIDVTVTPPPVGSGYKCAVAAITGCTTVRYEVQVGSGLASGSDTSVTVDSITDNSVVSVPVPGTLTTGFGNIAALNGNASTNHSVVGTTCGQAGSGLGTLSGESGAGVLPATIATTTTSTPYTCQFEGVICGAPGDHTNQITGNLTGHNSGNTSTFPDVPNDVNNGPNEGRVTIHVNDIVATGLNLCANRPQ